MGRLLGSLIVVVAVTCWAIAFGYLAYCVQDLHEAASLLTIGGVTFAALIYWIRAVYVSRDLSLTMNHLQGAVSALAPHIESVAFDGGNRVIWSTHLNAYPSLTEYVRKLMMKVADPELATKIKTLIENRRRGEVLFHTGGNGLGADQRWILFSLSPFEKNSFVTVLRDLTTHFASYNQLRQQFDQLQLFVDHAPFGIFYSSKQGKILGVNSTLCKWLDLPREEIIGRPVSDLIKDADSYRGMVRVFNKGGTGFKALLFKPEDDVQSKTSPSILCRLDNAVGLTAGELIQDSSYLDAAIPAVMINQYGDIASSNPAFTTMLGELNPRGKFCDLVAPAQRVDIVERLSKAFEQKTMTSPFEVRFDGDRIQTTAYPSRSISRGGIAEIMLQFIDISEQKRLQGQFIQSQKMQAVGQLAGGVAHDFNNLLTAMIGYCDLLLQRYLPNDPSYNDIIQIKQNANRAANLVRQLLAFSRQQTLQPKVTNITDNLVELSTLLRRLIGAGIELKMVHARDLWFVKADIGQLEQVIINLVVNARDAMKAGGILTLRTSNIHFAKQQRYGHDVIPKGDYVAVEVIDTGTGIAPEHLELIFEPFFSTKEVGEGTGLGLSTVYGIVKQTGGFVQVESKLGQGTTFKILLPRHNGVIEVESYKTEISAQDLTGGGRVLLVEDEDAVRMFSARALREKGYTVIEANNGDSALTMVKNGEKFDVLITDVVMPKMDGPTLNKKIRDIYPTAKTIFISGYTEDTFRKNLDDDADIHFLPKPYTLKDLAVKVKEVLVVN
ncbi:MAG: response regulator [Candidatus Paracaedibacteraceae bacterium]|nr:response regulator [Candidatus Paracaedibacteraceae bacterium]